MELFNPHLYDLENPELWVAFGLILFLVIVVVSGALRTVVGALDAKAAKIQGELDGAARLRAEAEALLAQIRQEKAEAEAQAREMMAAAEAEARRMQEESRARLQESLARRQTLAERRIAQAEAQAIADVKAAAADRAAELAQRILLARTQAGADPLVDQAIDEVAARLN